jgi:exonuclease SbcD
LLSFALFYPYFTIFTRDKTTSIRTVEMMKILHTADWHLGKRLNDYSRLKEQEDVLNEICEIAEREGVDAVIIAGDLFDTFNPASEAVELFYKTVCRLAAGGQRAVVAIAGNHDSADRIEAPDPMARACGIIFCGRPISSPQTFHLDTGLALVKSTPGYIELQLPKQKWPLRIIVTPYANEQTMKQFLGTGDREEALRSLVEKTWREIADTYCDDKGVNILMAHLYVMEKGGPQPEEPEDEKPILHMGGAQAIFTESIPEHVQYAALGHLHRYHWVGKAHCPVVYSGSPLGYSFSEAHQQKQVILIEAEPTEQVKVKAIPLASGRKLVKKRFEAVDEALLWLEENPNTYVELTLQSDTYIDAKTKKALFQAHDGIVNIIPAFTSNFEPKNTKPVAEFTDIRKAFKDYFNARKGQDPDQALMEVFNEVLDLSNEEPQ